MAACLFLGCWGIHLHFTQSLWAIGCEFRSAISSIFPTSGALHPSFSSLCSTTLWFSQPQWVAPPPARFHTTLNKHMFRWLWTGVPWRPLDQECALEANLTTLESGLGSVQEKTFRRWPLPPYFDNSEEHLLRAKRTKLHHIFSIDFSTSAWCRHWALTW